MEDLKHEALLRVKGAAGLAEGRADFRHFAAVVLLCIGEICQSGERLNPLALPLGFGAAKGCTQHRLYLKA
jgi:hypothetical protein